MNAISEALSVFKTEMEGAAKNTAIVAAGAHLRASTIAASSPLPDQLANITAHIASHTATRSDGTVSVLDDIGLPRLVYTAGHPEMTLGQLLTETRTDHPEWFVPTPAETAAQSVITAAKVRTALEARIRAASLAKAVRPVASAYSYEGHNPFADATINVPAQLAVLSRSAALALRMKADARHARK